MVIYDQCPRNDAFIGIDGLEALASIHPAVCQGAIPPDEGLIVVL
ncbi:MAG: hypothetical protein WBN18_05890 [Flavobacteriaceae bacterium]